MITYSYFLYNRPLDERLYNALLQCVPEHMRTAIVKCRRWEDRQNRLFARLLLRDLLFAEGYAPDSLERLYANEYGKLFIDDRVDFNLSHSGNLVMVALSTCGRIGIDVERKDGLQAQDIATALRSDELEMLRQPVSQEAVYHLWTKKESLVKARGQGLSLDVKAIYLYADRGVLKTGNCHETWYYHPLQIHTDYIAVLCSEAANPILRYAPAEDLIDRAIRHSGIDISET
ncbi:4'-phosphopantetheinyl transferase family protein [Chitinophaga vietnamensis]|uniref:4'-phosphopantetheinyl transferase family protein n=1 Tax=Chitinophaga vietnamensis TaxID=2593957 RepID=UPI0011785665|nr:4'-phosphopantetheinyl transferase superfamily protein [Chitinophaga vietnamensis]